MGKSTSAVADHDAGNDRKPARVGSRTKKAKVVFDPSDHHVPRKRNRRGENDLSAATSTPKSEPNRTATPSSSSSTDGGSNNVSTSSGGCYGMSQSPLFRFCMVCGKNGPGRMPRKSSIAPWTCPACLWDKDAEKGSKDHNKHEEQNNPQLSSSNRVDEEEDNRQQHDFAGFSETELSGHGNDDDEPSNEIASVPIKVEQEPDSDDSRRGSRDQAFCKQEKPEDSVQNEAKEIRYWSCDDVCQYFSQHCQGWGDLFHEQEIDGPSLLLMQKGDVLSRFGLKLGPAMELYQRIVALQNGDRDIVDVRLTWI